MTTDTIVGLANLLGVGDDNLDGVRPFAAVFNDHHIRVRHHIGVVAEHAEERVGPGGATVEKFAP